MRRNIIALVLLAMLVTACASSSTSPTPTSQVTSQATSSLTVTDGSNKKVYTLDDLKALHTSQAAVQGVTYQGVPLATLLQDAGFDPQKLSAVKVTAVDGFTVNYDPQVVNQADTLVAYARADGPLAENEGPFRMVLPGKEGKMNPRQIVEIRVIP